MEDSQTTVRVNSDGAWKAMITEFFELFVAFFFPELYAQIDFSVPPEFLDQELLDIQGKFGKIRKTAYLCEWNHEVGHQRGTGVWKIYKNKRKDEEYRFKMDGAQ